MTSKQQECDIRKAIKSDLKPKSKEAGDLLYQGLWDAYYYQEQIGGMYCNSATFNEHNEELAVVLKNLEKAKKNLQAIEGALHVTEKDAPTVLDSLFYAANEKDSTLLEIGHSLILAEKMKPEESVFYWLIERMLITFDYAVSQAPSIGKGSARREAKRYIAGIEMLARYFSEAIPDKKPSKSQNSLFYAYVRIWFQKILGKIGNDEADIRRHIANTLNNNNVRLHRIK